MRVCRPRKLIYLAIDGVGPRAKLNQQRTRRYSKAVESETKARKEKELRLKYAEKLEALDKVT